MNKQQERRELRIQAYLTEYAKAGNITKACEAAGISRATIREWRNHDEIGEDFRQRENDAQAEFGDSLLEAIVERARDGWHEPVIYQGRQSYVTNPQTGELELDDNFEPIPLTILKKSDQVLVRAAEAHIPAYRKGSSIAVGGLGDGDAVPSKITIEFVESDGQGREAQAAVEET